MNALIIGGSGGLSSVVAGLAMKEYRVWTVTRGLRELPAGVIPVKADRNDPEDLRRALDAQNVRWDVVFDCICMNSEHAEAMVDCAENEKTFQQVFCIGGPEAVENRTYYEAVAACLGVGLNIEEVPLSGYLEQHPEYSGHLCHRIYDLSKLKEAGVRMPAVKLKEGIARSLVSMGYDLMCKEMQNDCSNSCS